MKQSSKFGILIGLTTVFILTGCTLVSTANRSSITPTKISGETNQPLPTPQTSKQTMTPTTTPSLTPDILLSPAAGALTLEDAQGAVIVTVTPLNLDRPGDTIDFEVAMDTHSVDLSMDLAALASLSTDTGVTVTPTLWDAPMGGHHVTGKLSFPVTTGGTSVIDGVQALTLTIRDVDAPQRTFTWELNIN
jgi:hypothetical protein